MANSNRDSGFIRFINVLGPFLGLLLVIGLFWILERRKIAEDSSITPFFLTTANFKLVLTQSVIVAIGALGMTMIIVSAGIDLSVGSVVALTSVVGAQMLARGHSGAVAAALATILAGALIGAINGFAIGQLRMIPFIVTLGMMGIARGTAKWLAESGTVNLRREDGTMPPPGHTIEMLMAGEDPVARLEASRRWWR